ncbi:hypothetical protein ABK040_012111 [Willaertia magna]
MVIKFPSLFLNALTETTTNNITIDKTQFTIELNGIGDKTVLLKHFTFNHKHNTNNNNQGDNNNEQVYEFGWLGTTGPKFLHLFDAYHYFKIEPISENSCRLIHQETFSGLLIPIAKLFAFNKPSFKEQWIKFNQKVKRETENRN